MTDISRDHAGRSRRAVRVDVNGHRVSRFEHSEGELRVGSISQSNRQLAELLLSCRGYVILKNAVPDDYVRTLRAEFDAIYEDCRHTANLVETGADPDAAHQVRVYEGLVAKLDRKRNATDVFASE